MRFRFLAFGVIAGMLAACTSGSADGTSTPTPTPSHVPTSAVSSATPSAPRTGPLTTGPNVRPGEKPPVLPPEAKRHTDFGASLFGAYYFRALDWTIATNDAALVKAISAPRCNACRRVLSAVRTLRARHEVETGGRITLRSFRTIQGRFSIEADAVVRVIYDEAAVQLSKNGARARTTVEAVRAARSNVFLSWSSSGWRVIEVNEA